MMGVRLVMGEASMVAGYNGRMSSYMKPLMKPLMKIVWLGAVAVFIFAAGQNHTTVTHAQSAATVWDGVYTDAQATRGKTVYADKCAVCHGKALEGTTLAPGLSGADFAGDFEDSTLGQVFSRIMRTMPADDPGSLTPAQVSDILAAIGDANKWPAGQKELPADQDALKLIKIVKKK